MDLQKFGLNNWKRALVSLLLAALVIEIDIQTKQWATESLVLYRPQQVNSWLNFTLAHNYGAAFSMLSDAGGWQRWPYRGSDRARRS